MEKIISAVNVSQRYERAGRPFWAVTGASIEIALGEFVTIFGRSGSGKSTLLNILIGLIPGTKGKVMLAGTSLSAITDADRAKLRNEVVGYVPQMPGLVATLSVIDNVRLPWHLTGQRGPEPEGRAMELLRAVGLEDLAGQYPAALSGGEARRAVVARALMCSPKILVADEPTASLDPESARNVIHIFQDFVKKGGAVLMVTHDDYSLEVSTRIHDMEGGVLATRFLHKKTHNGLDQ